MKHYYSALKKNLIHVDKIEKETQRLTEKNKNCYRDHHARLLSCATPTKLKNLSTKDEYLAELLKFRTMITKILLFSFYYGKRSVANQNLKSLAYSASSLFQYDSGLILQLITSLVWKLLTRLLFTLIWNTTQETLSLLAIYFRLIVSGIFSKILPAG